MTDLAITFATYPTAFETPGGGEIQILQYRKHLAALGVDVTLFDPWKSSLGSVDIFHYFSCYRGSEIFIDELYRRGISIILSPTLWIEEGATGYPMAQIGQMLKIAARIVCNSDMECNLLAATFTVPRHKFSTVYNGVDPSFMRPVDPEVFRSFSGVRGDFILNVANVEPRKNQLRLIEAVKRLGMKLVMIGGIRDQAYFAQCMELGRGCLTYIPALPHDSDVLRSAYAACSIFALPSTLETPGLAALEAACVGARVLVTEVGCAQEYFQTSAVYVAPMSVDSIVEGLRRGLARPNSNAARDHVREKFTWPVVVERLLDVYLNRDIFGHALFASGFHLSAFDPLLGRHVWSKHAAVIVCDRSGFLTFDWCAPQHSKVAVKVNGELVWPELEVGTEFSSMVLAAPLGPGDQRPRVEFEVKPLEREQASADPRSLGVMFRDVRFLRSEEEMRAAGMLFELLGLQGQGWYRAEEDGFEPFIWSRRRALLLCDQSGVLSFDWRAAQPSRVNVMVDGVLLWSELEMGTQWSQASIRLHPTIPGGRVQIVFEVTPVDLAVCSADPRELGLALRGLSIKNMEKQILQ
jgi:glycosyltransferase involved in cell wall biosynthesis